MNPVLQQLDALRGERDQARDAALALATSEDFDPASEAYTGLEARASKLDTQIEHLAKLVEQQTAADAIDGKMAKQSRLQVMERANEQEAKRQSWGEAFVSSDVYDQYNFRGTSGKVEVRALPHTLTDMADVLPSAPVIDMTPAPTPNLILPMVNQISVSQNNVEYVVWAKAAGGAAVVPEGTLKPSIEWSPTVTSRSLVTIAGHTSLTRQLAEDAAAVRSYLTGELQNEVRRKVEAEAVAAVVAATLPTASGPSGTGLLGAIRAGMAEVQGNGFAPNAFLVSSDDLIELDLAVMTTAGTGPNQNNAFWGLRPVVDTAGILGAGEIIVGDFRSGVHHYSRNSVQLYMTDSHGENFRYNILDAIAETRCLTAVVRPDALVTATAGA